MVNLSIYYYKSVAGKPRFIKVDQGFFGQKLAFFSLVFLIFDALVFIRAALRQILSIIAQNKDWGNEGEYQGKVSTNTYFIRC